MDFNLEVDNSSSVEKIFRLMNAKLIARLQDKRSAKLLNLFNQIKTCFHLFAKCGLEFVQTIKMIIQIYMLLRVQMLCDK